ncbi:hypothetical protein [Paracraurococcus lichenis]|uniref:Integrase n=1 Tax=Paracraurococcus lichenis TaxID=3064888 RepID=A0ABT9E3K7_9PROT|nr:hypothetical protein [Paracraurococcus sp. LOR1-02]MDO9710755.1 hypothetical protein [Paracraurococcus sp. LOR1-02]
MTAAILPFVGTAQASAKQNLAALIRHAQRQRLFTEPNAIKWADNSWDLRPFAFTRGQNPPGYMIHFTTYETAGVGVMAGRGDDFSPPFLDAAKAILVEFFLTNGMPNPSRFLITIRIIEKAFRSLGITPDICALQPKILDRAAEIVSENYKDAWTFGRYLERLALGLINPARLSAAHLVWKNPITYQGARRADRVNTQAGFPEGSERLPQLKCILDLAGIFHNHRSNPDIVVTAWFALAMFSPTRVNEILTLPLDCETEMGGVYGLSWRPLKGGDAMTKYATTEEWAIVAQSAIARLRELGAPARKAAAWYAQRPNQLYLPQEFDHLRGEPLTRWEIRRILGLRGPITLHSKLDQSLRWSGLITNDRSRTGNFASGEERDRGSPTRLYTFESVERYVSTVLPAGFPIADKRHNLLASDALFCLPRHVMHAESGIQLNVPDLISYSQIYHDLGGKPTGSTIFRRHGLLDPETGRPWQLTTHQPRHLLNTLAQSKHLSEALIAFWSGRKRVSQNAWYDHIPQEAFIEAFVALGEHAPKQIRVIGPLEDKVVERAHREMVSHDDALRLELGSIIATRYGLCRHNYALTPCPKDKDCISCGENTFVKGDPKQLAEAHKQHAISLRAAENCRRMSTDGEIDVEKWLRKHEEAAGRWALAIKQLIDPTIPDGTLITLPPPQVTQTRTGLSAAIRSVEIKDATDYVTNTDEVGDALSLGGGI